ncbi:hypothetical protein [Agitococcus lubricus]|uniref:Ribbon-helix-helix CopG family protein n=1 Tax=Agitococcus lubricus TaxID=1077255 RepID=A0A2T5J1M7_9GAMM|nr:hypothetical protein [Agitococcus lubricus]PTQ90253.1 hypothetical protein C8N29_1035 [Agitococcus lubricus]
MYQDPNLVRIHRVTTNLNAYEIRLLDQIAKQTGRDRASIVRELIMNQANQVLGNHGLSEHKKTGTN